MSSFDFSQFDANILDIIRSNSSKPWSVRLDRFSNIHLSNSLQQAIFNFVNNKFWPDYDVHIKAKELFDVSNRDRSTDPVLTLIVSPYTIDQFLETKNLTRILSFDNVGVRYEAGQHRDQHEKPEEFRAKMRRLVDLVPTLSINVNSADTWHSYIYPDFVAYVRSISEFCWANDRHNPFPDLSGCVRLTHIGQGAFLGVERANLDLSGCRSLKHIGDRAFYDLTIAPVNLFKGCISLEYLGAHAFSKLRNTLDFSDCVALKKIDDYCFKSVVLAPNFSGCQSLQEIGSEAFFSLNDRELDLSGCPNLETISNEAFSSLELCNSRLLNGLNKLKIIEFGAFTNLTRTTEHKLDLSGCSSLEKIHSRAFFSLIDQVDLSGCVNLRSIENNAFVSTIYPPILENCINLKIIDSAAFYSLRETPDLSDCVSLEVIGYYSFFNVHRLPNLNKCSSLIYLQEHAFKHATGELPDFRNFPQLEIIGEECFYSATEGKLDFSNCQDLIIIGNRAFYSYKGTVEFGDCLSLDTIGEEAFANVSSPIDTSLCSQLQN